jgi:hypothetical protein
MYAFDITFYLRGQAQVLRSAENSKPAKINRVVRGVSTDREASRAPPISRSR